MKHRTIRAVALGVVVAVALSTVAVVAQPAGAAKPPPGTPKIVKNLPTSGNIPAAVQTGANTYTVTGSTGSVGVATPTTATGSTQEPEDSIGGSTPGTIDSNSWSYYATVTASMVGDDGNVDLPYVFTLPTGDQLVSMGSNVYAITTAATAAKVKKGNTFGFVQAPRAVDTNGNLVGTSWVQYGPSALIQVVNPSECTTVYGTSCTTAFPLEADPSISFGWVIYVHFSEGECGGIALVNAVYGSSGAGIVADWVALVLGAWDPIAGAVAAVVLLLWDMFAWLSTTAFHRGGGLVLEFSYDLQLAGAMYVGNNWS
jgi:hypothetical protein